MRFLLKICLIICGSLMLSLSLKVYSQEAIRNEKYQVSLQKDTLSIPSGQFGYNSFSIVNTSNVEQSLGIKVILPVGWNLINMIPGSIKLNPGNVETQPLRIAPSQNAIGNIAYPVLIIINNPVTQSEEKYVFWVKINQLIKWNASLLNQYLSITPTDSLRFFEIKLSNSGNKRELFLIDFETKLRLSHSSAGTQILVNPKKDTTLKIYVKNRTIVSGSNHVGVTVTSRSGSKKLSQYVVFLSDTFYEHSSKYQSMALDVSYAGMNLGSNGIGFDFLDINGQYDLGKLRNINFKIRQSLNGNTENMPAFYQFNYYSTRFGLSLGSQVDFMNYQIDGPGLRLNFRGKKDGSTEVFGINSRIGNVEIAGFRQEAIIGKKIAIKTQSLIANDHQYSSTSFFSVHNLNIDLRNRQNIQITGGYSAEKATKIGQINPGYAFGYRLGFDKKKYSVLSNHISYSAYFPGITRGLTLSQHELRLYRGRVFFGGLIDYNYREPVMYFEENTNSRLEFQIKDFQYGLKVGIFRGAFNYSLNGVQIYQVQNSLENAPMTGQKIQMVFSHVKGRYNQNLNASYILSKMKDFDNNKYQNGYNAFYQLRKNNLGFLLNIDYGLNYYFDYQILKSTSKKPLRENYSVFYEIKSKSENINERINLAMIRNAAGTPPALIFRNEFDIQIPKIKASINILAGINVLNINQTPNFNIIFKKSLDVPMAFKPRFYDLGLFIFKDKNNNEIFDKGDEPIENAMLGVNGNQVLTNAKGQATIKNMSKGDYLIDLKKIYNLKGWIPKKGLKDSVTINGKTMVGIPFKMSKVISGKITYVAEYATDATPPSLSGILVVAVNQKGEVFKTLTNMSGEFFFNLNDDVYNIQIPENVFSNNLFIEKSIKRVDLRTENGSSLEFKVIQKKRKINIKKD